MAEGIVALRKLVCGVGINDLPELPTYSIYYRVWRGMLYRCSRASHARRPTYAGCVVCDEWKVFSAFKAWMETQDFNGKQLDKDLLGDKKLYSPDTCVFVTKEINLFTGDHAAGRGEYKIGVDKYKNRYRSQITLFSKRKHLGYFDTEDQAHAAWVVAKKKQAKHLAELQSDEKVAFGLLRYAKMLDTEKTA